MLSGRQLSVMRKLLAPLSLLHAVDAEMERGEHVEQAGVRETFGNC